MPSISASPADTASNTYQNVGVILLQQFGCLQQGFCSFSRVAGVGKNNPVSTGSSDVPALLPECLTQQLSTMEVLCGGIQGSHVFRSQAVHPMKRRLQTIIFRSLFAICKWWSKNEASGGEIV
jgi:hypothetical protein